jgi:hypothetical protein
MQAGVRKYLLRDCGRLVAGVDQLAHQPGHGVGIERLAPFGGEDQAVMVNPGQICRLSFFLLAATVLLQDGNGFSIDADHARAAALGSALHSFTPHHGGGAAERNLSGIQIDGLPAEVEQLAATSAGVGSEPVEGVQPVGSRGDQESVKLLGGPDAAWLGTAIPGVWIARPD